MKVKKLENSASSLLKALAGRGKEWARESIRPTPHNFHRILVDRSRSNGGWLRRGEHEYRGEGGAISNIIERVPESDALYGDFDEAGQPWEKDQKDVEEEEYGGSRREGRMSCNLAV